MAAHTNNPTTERLRQEDRSLTDSRSAWPRVEGPVSERKKKEYQGQRRGSQCPWGLLGEAEFPRGHRSSLRALVS